jgi:hypothetical protein
MRQPARRAGGTVAAQNSLITTLTETVSAIESSSDVMRQPGPHPKTRTRPAGYGLRPLTGRPSLIYRLVSSASYGSRLPDFARPRESRYPTVRMVA